MTFTKQQAQALGTGFGAIVAASRTQKRADGRKLARLHVIIETPGTVDQVNVDWWLRQIREAVEPLGVGVELEDTSTTEERIDSDDYGLRQRLADAKAYIEDLEEQLNQRREDIRQELLDEIPMVTATSSSNKEVDWAQALETARSRDDQSFYSADGKRWITCEKATELYGISRATLSRAIAGEKTRHSVHAKVCLKRGKYREYLIAADSHSVRPRKSSHKTTSSAKPLTQSDPQSVQSSSTPVRNEREKPVIDLDKKPVILPTTNGRQPIQPFGRSTNKAASNLFDKLRVHVRDLAIGDVIADASYDPNTGTSGRRYEILSIALPDRSYRRVATVINTETSETCSMTFNSGGSGYPELVVAGPKLDAAKRDLSLVEAKGGHQSPLWIGERRLDTLK